MVYIRGLETNMKWRIKTKTALDCVHKGFAWLPTKIGDHMYWLESYYYYKLGPDYANDGWTRVKFKDYQRCVEEAFSMAAKGVSIK